MTARVNVLLALCVLVAAWLQAALSNHIALWSGRPDFILTTIVCASILLGPVNTAMLNIWGGFLTSVLAGVNYGSIMISRLITGSLAGLLRQHVIQDSMAVPIITVFLSTWISESLYFVMAPDLHSLKWWIRMVLAQSLYNSAISVPIYFGLRLINVKEQSESNLNPFLDAL